MSLRGRWAGLFVVLQQQRRRREAAAGNVAPVAEFSHVVTLRNVQFTDESSDADGAIVAWDWDFGDGTAHGTTQNPSHDYATDGAKTVRLTVTDDDGATHYVEHVVTPVRATIALAQEDANGSTTDGLTFDTAPIDFVAGQPVIIGIASSQAGATGQTPSSVIAGPGAQALSFTQVGAAVDVTVSPSRRLTAWRLTPNATFSAAVRISFVTTNQTSCVWIPIHGVGVAASPVRQVSAPVTGTGPAAAAGALAAFEHANNVCLAFFLTASALIAPADGETELAEPAQASTTLNLQAEWKVNDPTAAATIASAAAYAAISMELEAA